MSGARVLVVEDEALVAEDLREKLERLGYSVVGTAASGTAALDFAELARPDLLLMDVHLRGPMDGIEAARRIRETLGVPVVFLTAYSDDATLQRAKVTEPFGYLIKPVDSRELNATLAMALHKHELENRIRRAQREKEAVIEQLQGALADIKTLRGMIRICAWCKKIRDDEGFWSTLETYLKAHTEAEFTHGICPICLEQQATKG